MGAGRNSTPSLQLTYMANPFTEHILTVGATKYLVHLPDEYEEIGEIVNIHKSTNPEQKVGAVPTTIDLLVEYSQVVRVRVGTGSNAISGRRLKYRSIVCPVDKFIVARESLKGKSLGTQGTIQTVGTKRSRRLG